MASATKTTTDHQEIRHWVESHGGKPATVRGTEDRTGAGVLRFAFRDKGDEDLEVIDWDEWFAKFDDAGVALLYQEHKASGEDSTFFKLVNP